MDRSRDTVLLTGIGGFIARHVALALLHAGYIVRGTVRSRGAADRVRAVLAAAGGDITRLDFAVADLTQDDGWDAAARGCRYVVHTASPFPSRPPRDKFALVPVAREGTLRVIEAAKRHGAERVVLTSSTAAIAYGHPPRIPALFDASDVSDVNGPAISSYAVSKTLAEQAAWAAVEGSQVSLCSLNPSFVLGPPIGAETGTSVRLVLAMMKGQMPVVPALSLGVVDVRDVAAAHVAALAADRAAGRRLILWAGARSLMDIGAAIGEAHPSYRRRMPRLALPDAAVRLAARVSSGAANIVPELGVQKQFDVSPAETILGLRFRSPEEAITATAESLIRQRLI
ncbi:NAD-dependent epimerase/dehydratase family protein [Mangrovicella endophytica]|uniref:NAD-dependent epimerase/dehydratase family protein n=1 Tax=Mangrovicella endophytica TaxID=2066697 RepID=UPI000C9EBDDE|nr:NAD-dependent epimerase/dehydratase family protein [Mangrovicella endophytica]